MNAPADQPELVLWTDAARAPLLGRMLEHLAGQVRTLAVGGPRSRERDDLANQLQAPAYDDLRQMAIDRPAGFFLLATLDQTDPADLPPILAAGSAMLCLEPPASNQVELQTLWNKPQPQGSLETFGSFLQTPGWRQAAHPWDALGDLRLLQLTSLGQEGEQSLFAHLCDAWRVLLACCPVPDAIDAALAGPLPPAPENPRSLTGQLTAHARFGNQRVCTLAVGDTAPARCRQFLLLGTDAQLAVTQQHYELHARTGELLDQHAPQPTADFAGQLAQVLRERLHAPADDEIRLNPQRESHVLACALACLLSARTGEAESPQQVQKMTV